MKRLTNKIIAREILIFFGSLILIGLVYLPSQYYENYRAKKIEVLTSKIELTQSSIINTLNLWSDLKNNVPGFTLSLQDFKNDMKNVVNRKTLHKNLKRKYPSEVYEHFTKSFEEFSHELGFYEDKAELDLENNKIKLEQEREYIISKKGGLYYFKWFSCLLLAFAYPIRGSFYMIKWSIKTLDAST